MEAKSDLKFGHSNGVSSVCSTAVLHCAPCSERYEEAMAVEGDGRKRFSGT